MPRPKPFAVLRGHEDEVTSCSFLDASHVVSCGTSGSLNVWDLASRSIIARDTPHEDGGCIHACAAADGRVLSQGKAGDIVVWKWGPGRAGLVRERQWALPGPSFCKVDAHGEHGVLGPAASRGDVALWDTREPSQRPASVLCVPRAREQLGEVMAVRAATGGGNTVAAGYEGGHVAVLDLRAPASAELGRGHCLGDAVLSVDWDAARGRGVACGAAAALVPFKVAESGVETRQATPLRYLGASAVRIRADARLVAAGCWDGRVRLFKWPSMTPLGTLSGHAGGVSHVAYAPDGAFASCGKDGVVKLWDCYAGR